jgi:C4-type Zn-finger protein
MVWDEKIKGLTCPECGYNGEMDYRKEEGDYFDQIIRFFKCPEYRKTEVS